VRLFSISLRCYGDQERFLKSGKKQMSLASSRQARKKTQVTTGWSASPVSLERGWSKYSWKPSPNI